MECGFELSLPSLRSIICLDMRHHRHEQHPTVTDMSGAGMRHATILPFVDTNQDGDQYLIKAVDQKTIPATQK